MDMTKLLMLYIVLSVQMRGINNLATNNEIDTGNVTHRQVLFKDGTQLVKK